MNRTPKAGYTKESREEAVKLAEAVGASEASLLRQYFPAQHRAIHAVR